MRLSLGKKKRKNKCVNARNDRRTSTVWQCVSAYTRWDFIGSHLNVNIVANWRGRIVKLSHIMRELARALARIRGYVSKSNLSAWSFVRYLMLFVRNSRAYQTMPDSTPNALVWTSHHPRSPSLRALLISSLNSANIPSSMRLVDRRVNLPIFFLTFPYHVIILTNWSLTLFRLTIDKRQSNSKLPTFRWYRRSTNRSTDSPFLSFYFSFPIPRFEFSFNHTSELYTIRGIILRHIRRTIDFVIQQ